MSPEAIESIELNWIIHYVFLKLQPGSLILA